MPDIQETRRLLEARERDDQLIEIDPAGNILPVRHRPDRDDERAKPTVIRDAQGEYAR